MAFAQFLFCVTYDEYVVCGMSCWACCVTYDETITDRHLLFTTCMTYDETITDMYNNVDLCRHT